MKKQSIIITIFSSVIAGTLIFLGIFFALKPDQEVKKGGLTEEDQILEKEFQAAKKKFAAFDFNEFQDRFQDSSYVFQLIESEMQQEKGAYQGKLKKLGEEYKTIKASFDQYEKFIQEQKEIFKNLNQNAIAFFESCGNFTVSYDQGYEKFLNKTIIDLFLNVDQLQIDFFNSSDQTAFEKNVTDYKQNLTLDFSNHKYNLTEQEKQQKYQEHQKKVNDFVDGIKKKEKEFNKVLDELQERFKALKDVVDQNYQLIETTIKANHFSAYFEDKNQFESEFNAIKIEYNEYQNNDCNKKYQTRLEKRKCFEQDNFFTGYETFKNQVAQLKKSLDDGLEVVNNIKNIQNQFEIDLQNTKDNFKDNLEDKFTSALEAINIIKNGITEVENTICDQINSQKVQACWQDKNKKITVLKQLLSNQEAIQQFINDIGVIKEENDSVKYHDILNYNLMASFFDLEIITGVFKDDFNSFVQGNHNSKLFHTLKYENLLAAYFSGYQSLKKKETKLFTKDHYNYSELINEISQYIKFQNDLEAFVISKLNKGKLFGSYLNGLQISATTVVDFAKLGFTLKSFYHVCTSFSSSSILYVVLAAYVNYYYHVGDGTGGSVIINDYYDENNFITTNKNSSYPYIYSYSGAYKYQNLISNIYHLFKEEDLAAFSEIGKLSGLLFRNCFVIDFPVFFKTIEIKIENNDQILNITTLNVTALQEFETSKTIANEFYLSMPVQRLVVAATVNIPRLFFISAAVGTVVLVGPDAIKLFQDSFQDFFKFLPDFRYSPDGRKIPFLFSFGGKGESIMLPFNGAEIDHEFKINKIKINDHNEKYRIPSRVSIEHITKAKILTFENQKQGQKYQNNHDFLAAMLKKAVEKLKEKFKEIFPSKNINLLENSSQGPSIGMSGSETNNFEMSENEINNKENKHEILDSEDEEERAFRALKHSKYQIYQKEKEKKKTLKLICLKTKTSMKKKKMNKLYLMN